MPQSFIETLEQSFDMLNPYQKGLFIDARLDWATNGALCGQITQRICHTPLNDD